jgi:hypothetical protein
MNMNKIWLGILIGAAAILLAAGGVMAASWFWTGRVGLAQMPMMSSFRLPDR